MIVPYLDMRARHALQREEFMRAIGEVVDSGDFSGGPVVGLFEMEFSNYCGSLHAVGVRSGTEALWLTLLAMGIGPGDEVITVPMTFVATIEAICLVGAKPVFVDIDERTYTLDPEALKFALTPKSKAIIPVHLFGQTADMEPILAFARQHGLSVIEDAAQAHGAEYRGSRAGSMGDAGCFSFHPGKNLGAFGEGGAVVTRNEQLAEKIRILRNHGQSRKNVHSVVGWNSRMDGIQAAVLRIKLRHLDETNRIRRDHALRYSRSFKDLPGVVPPAVAGAGRHVFHVYAARVEERQRVTQGLDAQGIGYGIHYPIPVHLQPAYRNLGYIRGDFPISERCAGEFLSLPLSPEMTRDQADFVTTAVMDLVGKVHVTKVF